MSLSIPEFAKHITIYPNTFEFNYIKVLEEEGSEQKHSVNDIPRILHIIWVGDRDPPDYVLENIKKWTTLMPHWNIKFWTNNDLTITHFPLNIISLIDTVKKGAQKADIMRYFIMEKYGGVYVDTDVTPYRSLEPLITQLHNTDAILCHDLDLTWKYISIGFFAAIPNHPIFKTATEICNHVIINTEDIHMQTGPRLLGEAVARTQFHTKTILLPVKFFYRNINYDGRLGNHFYAKEW